MAPDAALRLVSDDILDDPHGRAGKVALYGAQAVDAEVARRRAARMQVVNLRGDDLPPPKDAWEMRRLAEGDKWNPIAAAGVRVSLPPIGELEVEQRRHAQRKATERQQTRWAVAVGVKLTFKSGKVAREGEAIALEDIGVEAHGNEVMRALVGRGFVSAIDPHTAWLRSLPSHVGPYVACKPFESHGRHFELGESVSEDDFPRPPEARSFAPGDSVADMTVAELDARIARALARYGLIKGLSVAPPISAFRASISLDNIVRAPNYDPSARAPESGATPPRAGKNAVISRLLGRKEQAK